jgi:transaldolase
VRGVLPPDGGDAEQVLADFSRGGVDIQLLAARLQLEGAASFALSWHLLMTRIVEKQG